MSAGSLKLLISAALLAVPALAHAQAQNDHLKCYKMKDAVARGK